jgi:hypothetical protein
MVHESHWSWTSRLDWVKLTAENTASSSYEVQWNLVGATEPLTTTIYWITEQGNEGSAIGTSYVVPSQTQEISGTVPLTYSIYMPSVIYNHTPGVEPEPGPDFSFTVGTEGLTDGNSYYIAIKLEDESTVDWAFSQAPVVKMPE